MIEGCILIVDDDGGDRKLMRRTLSVLYPSTKIIEAENGSNALKIDDSNIEVIFLDYLLPGISGLDLLSSFLRKWPKAAIFIMTGQGDEEIAKSAILSGAADYISKSSISAPALQRMIGNGLQVSKMRWRIEEHQKELQQFSDVLVHDLRAPIRAIKFLSDQILEDFESGDIEEVKREFDLMKRSVSKMSDLIERLASHINPHSAGKPEVVEISNLVEAACLAMAEDINRSNARIETKLSGLQTLCFPPDISQLIQNLIGNSIKYRSASDPVIEISACSLGKGVQVSVADNGIGVPQEYRHRIFEPFKRLQRSSDLPGTGLGLATCAKIAKRHNGDIWCDDQTENGTVIHFTLRLGSGSS
ncbi:hybrid sensor histidine kinase/response regulator [Phaeobacter sp. HF9A]|uniref:ATP-binding response regulator n=1 Tax=Phaeobacter sp. HF9A TaxID=2721561 RepID=UPI00142FC6EB|nr:hybrid sensor histidine kinase/response regulator [Phaeobacter sp. HF9A]NIZ13827.1 hybrid sensor histidine kinase/response regulator [Phaeobacter sp. HF9A]